MEKGSLGRNLIPFYNSLKGDCSQSERLDMRKKFLIEVFVKHWNSLPREELLSPFLKVFNRCVEVTLEDLV